MEKWLCLQQMPLLSQYDAERNSNAEGDSMCYWIQLWTISWMSQLKDADKLLLQGNQ